MKIAIMNPWAISSKAIGGTERFVEDLALSLKNLGNDVDVYMFSGKNHINKGVNYISLNLFGKDVIADEYMIIKKFGKFDNINSYISISKKLESLIDSSKYDLIQINSHFFLKAWQNKKRIITLHSNSQEFKVLWNNKEYNKMIEIMIEEAKNPNTKIVSPSIYYKNKWEKILKNKVYYIPHALNKKRLECNIDKNKLLNKYNLSNNKIKILLPSRLEPIQKQPKLILDAAALLEDKYKSKLQIIFTGIDKQYRKFVPQLKEFSKNNNIDSKFIIFDNISEAYKLTDLVVIPSKSESFGYSCLESLSLGIKTILSNIPTFKEISSNNKCAYIFDNNAYNLSKVLIEILNENNYERKTISNDWLNKYNLELFAKRYMEVFKDE